VSKKIDRVIEELNGKLSKWQAIETIMLMENENDVNDPYFFLSFDVYHSGELPRPAERQEALGEILAFETNSQGSKDRFLVGDVAVRLEYKPCRNYEPLLAQPEASSSESGTYALHRLKSGRVLFRHSDWIDRLRTAIETLPENFWVKRREACQLQMEHFLADMEAARIHQDRLFYTLSLAGFISRLCGTLFALNRRFEPNQRLVNRELLGLPVLPESFNGSLDILLRFGELPLGRHCEIAGLITRQVIAL
jgi:hypothetical protein